MFYARSADVDQKWPAQPYSDHIEGVRMTALSDFDEMASHFKGPRWRLRHLRDALEWAAYYHDFGKLDPLNQRILSGKETADRLPISHSDAGVAEFNQLSRLSWWDVDAMLNQQYPIAPSLIYAHHTGLPDFTELLREDDESFRNEDVRRHVDRELSSYRDNSRIALGKQPSFPNIPLFAWSGLERRLLLSCLIDGDHYDAALWCHDIGEIAYFPPRWEERLNQLIDYVDSLKTDSERSHLRTEFFDNCLNRTTRFKMECCSAPVGMGKTLAVMAHLLRWAIDHDARRIIVVLPFTNIVSQSTDVYRESLVLAGEDPESVVAEHQHLVQFRTRDHRVRTRLWNSPIIVTTAVQFFETLGDNRAKLRKLCKLPGSAIFVDEAHAAMPLSLWPCEWEWVTELSKSWNCLFCFGSGSLRKVWENQMLMGTSRRLPDLSPKPLRRKMEAYESKRIRYDQLNSSVTLAQLAHLIRQDASESKLAIFNTVWTSALFAKILAEMGEEVLYLSTSLTPIDRRRHVEAIRERLKMKDKPWTLVATSCVEAGVDFNFRKAYRELCSLGSTIQTSGRQNREGEWNGDSVTTVFKVSDPLANRNFQFEFTRRLLERMFDQFWFDQRSIEELIDYEYNHIVDETRVIEDSQPLRDNEACANFKTVAELCKVIETDTVPVVITPEIIDRLSQGENLPMRVIEQHVVQIYQNKLEKYKVLPIVGLEGLYQWTLDYDPDGLGYMAGVIETLNSEKDK